MARDGRSGNAGDGWRSRERILLAAVRDARLPAPHDLDLLARRIWEEMEGERSGAWDRLPPGSSAHARAMRIARVAVGCAASF